MTCSMCKCAEHKMRSDLKERDPDFFEYMCTRYPGFDVNNAFPLSIESGNLKTMRSRRGITVHLCANCVSTLKLAKKRCGFFEDVIDKLFIIDKSGNVIYKDYWCI